MDYDVGDRIKDEKRDITLTRIRRRNGRIEYQYKCNICNYACGEGYKSGEYITEYWLDKFHLEYGSQCLCCCNRCVVKGINDLHTTNPELEKYFFDKSDMYKYTKGSGKYAKVKCPRCGATKYVIVKNLVNFGFACDICSDGISYPNKFISNLLIQLNIPFEREKTFNWSCGKRYDIYVPKYNLIIENNGKQHYKDSFESISGRTLQEEQENDIIKEKMALSNNFNYIILDCRESNMSWIKNSILNSQLSSYIDISNVNWEKCDIDSSNNSIIKKVCLFWNDVKNITITAETFKMDIHTIQEYLEKGTKCGYCNYEKYSSLSRIYSSKQSNSKPIYSITDNIYFFSWNECQDYYRSLGDLSFNGKRIYLYINKNKPYHNIYFSYISKRMYNKLKYNSMKNITNYKIIGDIYNERYLEKEIV